MADSSISTLILFIGAIIVAASVASLLTTTVSTLGASVDDMGKSASDSIRTDIEIISDAGSDGAIYDDTNETVTLLIKNTGSNELDERQLDVLIDGEYATPNTTNVINGDEWEQNTVLRVKIDKSLAAGDHRIKVQQNGAEDFLRVNV